MQRPWNQQTIVVTGAGSGLGLAVCGRFVSLGAVDVLVNSAGITGKTNVKSHETDPADVARVFAVDFFGAYHTAKAALPGMIERGYGRVLHVASIAGKEGNAGMLAYSSSKAAVIRTPLVEAMPEARLSGGRATY